MRRFQAGDAGAFEALVRLWDRRLLALAHRLLGDRHDAEDVRQEAWVRCHLWLGRLRQVETFPAWIARIVVNLCRDRTRARRRRVPATAPPAQPADPVACCEQDEVQRLVQDALARLPELEREIVALRVVQELSFEEIARLVERPRSSVQLLYCRSVSTLARLAGRERPLPSRSADVV